MTISVYGEIREGALTRETKEVLTQAAQLKTSLDDCVELVLIEDRSFDFESFQDRWGIDSLFAFRQQERSAYCPEQTLGLLHRYCKKRQPEIFLFTGSVRGSELAPRLAFRNELEAILDCTELSFDPRENRMLATKPVYGGNIFCEYQVDFPCVIAMRPHQMPIQEIPARSISVQVEDAEPVKRPESIGNRRLISQRESGLEEQKVVFVCGRGIGGKENVERLTRLADRVHAGVGGTKKVIENGWLPIDQMVGQTGRILTPELCIVWGASGATPFLNGVEGAKRMIAINEDEEARIFETADLGIVTDCIRLLSEMERS